MLPFTSFFFTLLTLLSIVTTGTSFCLPKQTTGPQSTPTPTPTQAMPDTTNLPGHVFVERQERNNANPSVFNPPVTAAPTQEEALASLGWKQTTYYECKTRDGQERCGWHIPVYKAAAQGRAGEIVGWKVVVGIALGLAMLLYGGWW
ncbi:Ff.00g106930.m01.CDS01 [Fusarium sp. VM40]|nr:Ff.00g106930.m01.CDS01 [Fusarium sp. VM40]